MHKVSHAGVQMYWPWNSCPDPGTTQIYLAFVGAICQHAIDRSEVWFLPPYSFGTNQFTTNINQKLRADRLFF